jgi:hypothetical protein
VCTFKAANFKIRRTDAINWIRKGASGVWNGESAEIMGDTSKKMYEPKPRNVMTRTMTAIERCMVHR